jgi:hypothetical protein
MRDARISLFRFPDERPRPPASSSDPQLNALQSNKIFEKGVFLTLAWTAG